MITDVPFSTEKLLLHHGYLPPRLFLSLRVSLCGRLILFVQDSSSSMCVCVYVCISVCIYKYGCMSVHLCVSVGVFAKIFLLQVSGRGSFLHKPWPYTISMSLLAFALRDSTARLYSPEYPPQSGMRASPNRVEAEHEFLTSTNPPVVRASSLQEMSKWLPLKGPWASGS